MMIRAKPKQNSNRGFVLSAYPQHYPQENTETAQDGMGISEREDDMSRRVFNVTLEDGRKYTATGGTLNDALLNVCRHYAEKMGYTVGNKASECMTLKEFVETIFRPVYYPTLREKTRANYDEYLNRKILPFFGDKRLDEIKATDIQVWINELAEGGQHGLKPLNENSIKRILGLLKTLLKRAITAGEINDSPILKAKFITRKAEKGGHHKRMPKKVLKDAKRNALALPDERERLLLTLFFYTAMRPSEVYGLKWEHICLEEKGAYIHVCQAVTYCGTNKETVIDNTKTETSDRYIPIANDLLKVLNASQQTEGYVIRSTRGEETGKNPVSCSTSKRIFQSAMRHIGCEGYSAYDLRGSVATDLRERGVDANRLQQLLGHRDTRMLETIYARPRQEAQLEARDILNEAMCIKTD